MDNRKKYPRTEERKIEEEEVINKCIFAFLCVFISFFSMGLFSLEIDMALACLFIVIAVMSFIIMVMTPIGYVFSKERVVIKYLFGFEENIMWTKVLNVMTSLETSPRIYISWENYELCYREEKKKYFFMQGRIVKNKKTTKLMKKYCPRKID